MPAVEIARPQGGRVTRGGQQRAARERPAAEQRAAGDERDEQQHYEEHRSRLAGDALEAGELLDLQEVRVVAAGAGLDGAAVPSRGVDLGVGRAEDAARDLLDGEPDRGARRREERPQLLGVDHSPAAPAAGREDPLGPQQGAEESGDLVERLAGNLADEVRERARAACR